jgi:hypothetical protein
MLPCCHAAMLPCCHAAMLANVVGMRAWLHMFSSRRNVQPATGSAVHVVCDCAHIRMRTKA